MKLCNVIKSIAHSLHEVINMFTINAYITQKPKLCVVVIMVPCSSHEDVQILFLYLYIILNVQLYKVEYILS